MTKNACLYVISVLLITACSTVPEEADSLNLVQPQPNQTVLGNVELYTHRLANELFSQTAPARQSKYAVVGFVPMPKQAYRDESHHPLQLLGHQLKDGLITEAAKRGYGTQEFLLSDDIKVTSESDAVLTRDVDALSATHRVDYFITGTILHQERGAIVNARIVHVRSKEIVAAATTFFPAELFWQKEQMSTRNGRLIRQQRSLLPN